MSGLVVCYSRCWGCQFGSHPGGVHTWMDDEDIEFSKTATMPTNPHGWANLGATHPCNCWCITTPPCTVCQGSGEHPQDEEQPCGRCAGRGHPADVPVSMRAPDHLTVEHGPTSVRRELRRQGVSRRMVGRTVRRAVADCPPCQTWIAGRARVAALHHAYRQKGHR